VILAVEAAAVAAVEMAAVVAVDVRLGDGTSPVASHIPQLLRCCRHHQHCVVLAMAVAVAMAVAAAAAADRQRQVAAPTGALRQRRKKNNYDNTTERQVTALFTPTDRCKPNLSKRNPHYHTRMHLPTTRGANPWRSPPVQNQQRILQK
jgi:hypothetical protein